MLTCISRSKKPEGKPLDESSVEKESHGQSLPMKSVNSQFKDMAVQCAPCTGPAISDQAPTLTAGESDRFKWPSIRRTGSSNSSSQRMGWGKELEARLKGISSSSGEFVSGQFTGSSRRTEPPIVYLEEELPKEWVSQAEPGVFITFFSLPEGGNDLKRIRFSQEKFNKRRAREWWADNYDKIMELYNVRRLDRQTFPLPITETEDENSKTESTIHSPIMHELVKRQTPMMLGYLSPPKRSHKDSESTVFTPTPNISSISGTKTASSSADSIRSSCSRDAEDLSVGPGHDYGNEWVEEDVPGVYITVRALPNGKRELRRVRFSREMFGELHARMWWEENKGRVHQRYL